MNKPIDTSSESAHPVNNVQVNSPQIRPADLVPDDLLGVEGPLDHEDKPQPPNEDAPPGLASKPRPYSLVVLVFIIVATALVFAVIGAAQRGDLARILSQVVPSQLFLPVLVDRQSDVVLILERSGEFGRVNVIRAGQSSWFLVSGDDNTANNPAISANGKLVSYTSKRGGGQVVVVSLIDDTRFEIRSEQIQDASAVAQSELLRVCPWSSTAWNPNNTQVVFFACSQRRPYSTVVVASLPGMSLTLPAGGDVESIDSRQALWLTEQKIVITEPLSDTQQNGSVQIIAVP